jgi:MFS family permease
MSVGTGPLRRSRDFRHLWLAALPAGVAMGAVSLALFVQAWELTRSPAALGLLGLIQFAALAAGTLGGSAFVDHIDRRLLLLFTQAGFGITVLALWFGSLVGDPPILLLFAASALGSCVASLHFPTRSATIPAVVERSDLVASMTLDTVVWNVTMILGPLVGGAVLARFGLSAVYGIAVAGHVLTLSLLLRLDRQPTHSGREGRLGLSAIRHGFAYLRRRPVLRGLLWVDLIAMAFGMRRALFAILAIEQFHRGPEVVGFLMAAIPAGALIVSLTAGWLGNVHRQGLTLIVSAAVWGAAIAGFGLSGSNLWVALTLLAIAGGADIVASILRASIIQHEVPDGIRGRVWGVNFLVLNGGPRLGDLTAGMTASAWGATFSVISGGIASLVGTVVLAIAIPELLRYTSSQGIDRSDDATTPLRDEA